MPNTNRDIYAERLELDRKIRRHAASIIGDLHCMPLGEAQSILEEARRMVLLHEGMAIYKPITAEAAMLYARLPLGSIAASLRCIRLLELWVGYVESGVVNLEEAASLAVLVGSVPLSESRHIKQEDENDRSEVLVSPAPSIRLVKCGNDNGHD